MSTSKTSTPAATAPMAFGGPGNTSTAGNSRPTGATNGVASSVPPSAATNGTKAPIGTAGLDMLAQFTPVLNAANTKSTQTFPLEANHPAVAFYRSNLQKQVVSVLAEKKMKWTSLTLVRRGTDLIVMTNNPVTLVVATPDASQPGLADVMVKAKDICKQAPSAIAVELVTDKIWRASRDVFGQSVSLTIGESVGLAVPMPRASGTMGGYLILSKAGENGHTYGLTNDHVVRPWEYPEEGETQPSGAQQLQTVDLGLINSNSARTILSPSSVDLDGAIDKVGGILQTIDMNLSALSDYDDSLRVLLGGSAAAAPIRPNDLVRQLIYNDQVRIARLSDQNVAGVQQEIQLRRDRMDLVASIASQTFDPNLSDTELKASYSLLSQITSKIGSGSAASASSSGSSDIDVEKLRNGLMPWRSTFMTLRNSSTHMQAFKSREQEREKKMKLNTWTLIDQQGFDNKARSLAALFKAASRVEDDGALSQLRNMLLMIPDHKRVLGNRAFTSDAHTLDWGLVRVETPRDVSNFYSDIAEFLALPTCYYRSFPNVMPSDDKNIMMTFGMVNSFGTIAPGMRVFKHGRTTGVTIGTVNAVPETLNLDNKVVDEWVVVGSGGRDFGAKGDSGSWVLDEDARLVGLLHAGSMFNKCWVVDMRAVMEDVIKKTGMNPQLLFGDAWISSTTQTASGGEAKTDDDLDDILATLKALGSS